MQFHLKLFELFLHLKLKVLLLRAVLFHYLIIFVFILMKISKKWLELLFQSMIKYSAKVISIKYFDFRFETFIFLDKDLIFNNSFESFANWNFDFYPKFVKILEHPAFKKIVYFRLFYLLETIKALILELGNSYHFVLYWIISLMG